MIPFLCPTKNRAAQCRLLLESLHVNARGIFKPYIMWKADPEYIAGYQKLASEQWVKDMGAVFIQEQDFVKDFYRFLIDSGTHFALFMDDCIFYRPAGFTTQDLLGCLDDDTWCVSLRLGTNTQIQDYMNGEMQPELGVEASVQYGAFTEEELMVYWDFRKHHVHKNYGFHFSWDGVVYRTQDILDIFNYTDFTGTDNQHAIIPQRIENYMMNRRDAVKYKYMCCPIKSHVVCMNWNCTHQYANTGQKFGGGMREFQELYMLDHVIDLSSIDFSNVKSCHDELSFTYRKI